MKNLRRRIAAILVVALAFALALPATVAPAAIPAPAATALTPVAVTTADLTCATMASDTLAFAAGANGTIIKSSDGGSTWKVVRSGDTVLFTGIVFFDSTNGIAVTSARATYGTSDGGEHWVLRNADMTASQGGALFAVNGVTAVPGVLGKAFLAAGDPNAIDDTQYPAQSWLTNDPTNYGTYWGSGPRLNDERHIEIIGDELIHVGEGEILGVDFFDSSHGWAVGADLYPTLPVAPVYTTADGGYEWSPQTFPAALRLTGVAFGSVTNGVIVSTAGRVFYTSNGGTLWSEGTSPVTTAINGVAMTSATSGWAAGAAGKLLRTTNGGSSWTSATSPTTANLAAIALSGTHGVAVGKGGTIVYTANGSSWSLAGQAPVVDTTPPTMTSLTSSTHPVAETWYQTTSVTLAWTATDDSGVTGYSYAADTNPTTRPAETSLGSATTTTVVMPEGRNYFHVIARDAAGNWSTTPWNFAVFIDHTVPHTTDDHVATYADGVAQITLEPVDDLSGIKRTDWSLSGSTIEMGTGTSVLVRGAGSYNLAYKSTDNANNNEVMHYISFTIEGTVPPTAYVEVAGANRYDTAVAASKLAYPVSAPAVVIATGANWPDALGGAALAGAVDGPILLTDPKTLPASVRAEIVRLGATKAYVLGSESAVSKSVYDAIDGISGMVVERVAGANRYATANAIATKTTTLLGGAYDGTLFVATGLNFPDALAASPLSAAKGWPLYLAAPAGLTADTLTAMRAHGSKIVILGSTSAVPTLVENQLKAAFPATSAVVRVQGSDRYATGLAVVDYGVAHAGLTWQSPAIATGTNFPDALAGGVLQGLDGSILLLTNGTTLTPSVGAALGLHRLDIREVRYLGSESAVSTAVRASVLNIVK